MIHLTKRKWENADNPIPDANIWYRKNKDKDWSKFKFYSPGYMNEEEMNETNRIRNLHQTLLRKYNEAKEAKKNAKIVNHLKNATKTVRNELQRRVPYEDLPAVLKEKRDKGFTYTNYEPFLNILDNYWFARNERLVICAYAKTHNLPYDRASKMFYDAIDNMKKGDEWKQATKEGDGEKQDQLKIDVMEQFETPILDRWENISRAYVRNNLWRMNNAEDQGNGAAKIMMGLQTILVKEFGNLAANYANDAKTTVSKKLLTAYAGGVDDAVDKYQGDFVKKHLNEAQKEVFDTMSEEIQETMMGVPTVEGKLKFLETYKEHILDKGEKMMPGEIEWVNKDGSPGKAEFEWKGLDPEKDNIKFTFRGDFHDAGDDGEFQQDEADFDAYAGDEIIDLDKDEHAKKFKSKDKQKKKDAGSPMLPITFEGRSFFTPAQQNAIELLEVKEKKEFLKEASKARQEIKKTNPDLSNKEIKQKQTEASQELFRSKGYQEVEKLPSWMELYKRISERNQQVDQAAPPPEDPRPRPTLALSSSNTEYIAPEDPRPRPSLALSSYNTDIAPVARARPVYADSEIQTSAQISRQVSRPASPPPPGAIPVVGFPKIQWIMKIPDEEPRSTYVDSEVQTSALPSRQVSALPSRPVSPPIPMNDDPIERAIAPPEAKTTLPVPAPLPSKEDPRPRQQLPVNLPPSLDKKVYLTYTRCETST